MNDNPIIKNITDGIDSQYKTASKKLILILDDYNQLKSALYDKVKLNSD